MGLDTYGVFEEARMHLHRNAALGIAGRRRLVMLIEGGLSQRRAAVAMGVSPATANRWATRWRTASDAQRTNATCLWDRSSRPHRSPRKLSAAQEAGQASGSVRADLDPEVLTWLWHGLFLVAAVRNGIRDDGTALQAVDAARMLAELTAPEGGA